MNIGGRAKALAVIGTVSAAAAVLAGAGPAQAASSASYAASICGSGYWSIGSHSLQGGTIYVSYNGSTDCAVLIKTVDVGTPTETWVYIALDSSGTGGYGGDDGPRDDGNFTTYAGPVYVYAPSTCIEYAGGTVLNGDEYWSQPSFCN